MTTLATRSDVAAVGPILPTVTGDTLAYEDVFLMAAVLSPSSAFYRANQVDTNINGYTLILATAIVYDDASEGIGVSFSEATWGSALTGSIFPQLENNSTSQLLTFRLGAYELDFSTDMDTNYDDYVNTFIFNAFRDIQGLEPYELEGTPLRLGFDPNSNAIRLGIDENVEENYRILSNTMATYTGNPVNSVPGITALQAGIRYRLNPESLFTGGRVPVDRQLFIYPATGVVAGGKYAGLPNSVEVGSKMTVNAQEIDIVFLPVRWFTGSNCGVPIIVDGGNLDFGFYHFCDRWGALKGKTTPFYTQSCATMDANRGNSNQAQCTLVDNTMYLPATTGNTCGSQWRSGTTMLDMTDTNVSASQSLGPCGDGICGWDSTNNNFRCYEYVDTSATTCGADCSTCSTTDCSDCGTDRCSNFPPTADQCQTNCPSQMDCTNCTPTKNIPFWLWLIIIIIFLVIVLLLFLLLNRNANLKKKEDEFDLNGGEKEGDNDLVEF